MADPIAPQAFPYFAAVEEGKKISMVRLWAIRRAAVL